MAKAASAAAAAMNAGSEFDESAAGATETTAVLTGERRPGAPECPVEKKGERIHADTQVYKTKGNVQYCKCNDCGHTWSRPRPENVGSVSAGVMLQLADTLDSAPQIQNGSQMVIMVPIDEAKRLSCRIREICQAG